MQLPLTLAAAIQRLNARVKRQTNTKCFLSRPSFGTFEPFCDVSCTRPPSSERASVFSVRTSAVDHARLLVAFFMMTYLPKLFV